MSGSDHNLRRCFDDGAAFLRRAGRGRGSDPHPCILLLSDDPREGSTLARLAEIVPPPVADASDASLPSWHLGDGVAWLCAPFALAGNDSRWREFLGEMERRRRFLRPTGIVVAVDAGRLLTGSADAIRAAAALARSRLDRLQAATGELPPAYLLVTRIDSLYGMRSLAASMDAHFLGRVLGRFRQGRAEAPGDFAAATVHRCAAELFDAARKSRVFPASTGIAAAALQAGDELTRLRESVSLYCSEAFVDNAYQSSAVLGGVFFGNDGRRGRVHPPALARLSCFRQENEPENPGQSWFLFDLFHTAIPSQPVVFKTRKRGGGSVFSPRRPGFAVALVGAMLLCLLLTVVFLRERSAIMIARTAMAEADSEEGPARLFAAIGTIEQRGRGPLPGLGLDASKGILSRLRGRFCQAFEKQALAPGLTALSIAARSAAASGEAIAVCDALHLGARLRQAFLDGGKEATDAGEMFAAYRRWAAGRGWLDAALREIDACERLLAARIPRDGNAEWFAAWVDSLLGGRGVDTSAVWYPVVVPQPERDRRTLRPAWTGDGYQAIKALLAALPEGDGKNWPARRDALLASYRRRVLNAWNAAAARIWVDCRDHIGDDDLAPLLSRLAAGRDPVTVLRELARRDLALVLADSGAPDRLATDGEPAIAAFRDALREAAARSEADGCLATAVDYYRGEGAQDDNPLRRAVIAARPASVPSTHFPDTPALSPAAVADYLRFLVVRRAAVILDARWREEVFSPSSLRAAMRDPDTGAKPAELEQFLSSTARNLWRIEAGRLMNARQGRLPFMFSREFLDYCAHALSGNSESRSAAADMRFRVAAISVGAGARELPQLAEFVWTTAGGQQTLVYRNFPAAALFVWDRSSEPELTLRLHFPSGTAIWTVAGRLATAAFLRRLASGRVDLDAAAFTAGAKLLGRLGVETVTLRTSLSGAEALPRDGEGQAPRMPRSIITPGGGLRGGDMAAR